VGGDTHPRALRARPVREVQPARLRAVRATREESGARAAAPRSPVQCCSLRQCRWERAARGAMPSLLSSLQPDRSSWRRAAAVERKPRAPSAGSRHSGKEGLPTTESGQLCPAFGWKANNIGEQCKACRAAHCQGPQGTGPTQPPPPPPPSSCTPVNLSQPRRLSPVRRCSAGSPARVCPGVLARLRQPCRFRSCSRHRPARGQGEEQPTCGVRRLPPTKVSVLCRLGARLSSCLAPCVHPACRPPPPPTALTRQVC
jgi:hypothetical protein